jgi:hypothetical protein
LSGQKVKDGGALNAGLCESCLPQPSIKIEHSCQWIKILPFNGFDNMYETFSSLYISVLMYHKDCLIRWRSYPGCDMGRVCRRRVCATTYGCTRRKYPVAPLWCSSHEFAIPPSTIYLQRSCSRGKEKKPSCVQLSQRAYTVLQKIYLEVVSQARSVSLSITACRLFLNLRPAVWIQQRA